MEALNKVSADKNLKYKKVTYNPFDSGPILKAAPATKAQREVMASIRMDNEATLCYNESLVIEFNGEIDLEILNRAFTKVLERHDALRMVFSKDGKMISVKPSKHHFFDFIDLTYETDIEEKFNDLCRNEVITPFDLVEGPCFRALAVKLQQEKFSLVLSVHHIVCDGWSFGIILKELALIYTHLQQQQKPELKSAASFIDYAVSESPENKQEDLLYWKKEFSSLTEREMPSDRPRADYRTFKSKRIDFRIPETTVKLIKKISAREKCSFYNTLMTAFNVLMSRLTRQDQIVIGMASAQQAAIGEYDLVGHLVNLVPLKIELNSELSFAENLRRVRRKMLEAFEHQACAYGEIVQAMAHLPRKKGQLPLLDVVFNIDQQLNSSELLFGAIQASYRTIPREYENFELFINAVSSGDHLILECQYNSELYDLSTVTNWLQCYAQLLSRLEELCSLPLRELEIEELVIPSIKVSNAPVRIIQTENIEEEKILIEIWKKVLVRDEISRHDHFFSLGGHSLLAVEVQRLAEEKTGIKLQMKDLFSRPVLMELAERLAEQKGKNSQIVLPDLNTSEEQSGPLSINQMQIWYLEETHPGTIMHNLPAALLLKDEIDLQGLTRAYRLLIDRHPALRTSLRLIDGIPSQQIHSSSDINFKINYKKIKPELLESALNQEAQYVFNLQEAPLFKTTLYELSANEYVLFFMVHHAIWDGWSFDIFFEELDIAYRSVMSGKEPEFKKKTAVNYLDYTLWHQELMAKGLFAEDLVYWKKELQTPLPVLSLPLDHNRPPKINHEGGTYSFTLNEQQSYIVREYAKLNGVSLFNVFLTAFKLSLIVHDDQATRSGDIIVGMPVRGRTQDAIMNTIGFFVNTVALRTRLNPFAPFEENLEQVSQKCREALDHQLYPLPLLINELNLPRDKGRTPLFQAFFSFQDVSNRTSEFNGKRYTQVNVDRASTHTDIDLWIKAASEKIEGAFEYRKDLFEPETIKRFTEVFFNLISNLLIRIKKPLSLNDYIPESHRQLMLQEWNDTAVNRPFAPLAELFTDTAFKNAKNIAVVSESGQLTYEQLENESFKLACALRSQDIKAGDFIGVCLGRDHQLLTTLLAIIRLGAVYVPLDPNFPKDRLHYMVKDSRPKLIIGERKELFNEIGIKVSSPKELLHHPEVVTNFASFARVKKDDLMYVIYTSGSTGQPKGVQLGHGSVSNFLLAMKDKGLCSAKDRLLAVTTLSFDIAVLELFLPLICGGTVVMAQPHQVIDGEALNELINSHDITTLQATPSTWRLLLSSGWKGKKTLRALCGGEAFPQDLVNQLVPACKEVWNMYGPTETTVWSACKKMQPTDEKITVGKGIANTQLYILNEKRQLNPIGVTGEIYIAGEGLAIGYRNRPELTLEKFVTDPFRSNQKMYATGDLGRFNKDGEIICLGRNDSQIKMRGYRIELGEIESCLLGQKEIREACVLAFNANNDTKLIAYLSLKQNHLQEQELRRRLSTMLPPYMIPSHFVFLDDLPKTLNGKIDRKSMPEFKTGEVPKMSVSDVILSDSEQTVLRLFREVLSRKDLELDDNFFNAGGHSLLAVTFIGRVNSELKLQLPLSSLVEAKTMREFCHTFASARSKANQKENLPASAKLFRSLVTLKNEGEANPLYFFHGVGGNILNYVSLIPASKGKRPLMAFQSLGMDGQSDPLKSVEEMARHYIRELKLLQPHGPYLLAGGSMGGMIAFEVARQLQLQGDAVERLIMFDTFGPNLRLQNYSNEMVSGFWTRAKTSLSYRLGLITVAFQKAVHRFMGMQIPLQILLKTIERENYKALWQYRPMQYEGDLHLIRSNSAHGWYSDPVMGWKGIIKGKIHTYRINGSHADFIESPQLVDVLSKLISSNS